MGIIGEVIIASGGKIIGMWPTTGYEYETSKGEFTKELFYGLAIDEDNQMQQTEQRLKAWLAQVETELRAVLSGYVDATQ
ncbi:MAG: hypothetical protein AAGJ82_14175 [Bacteroidota bacterium]